MQTLTQDEIPYDLAGVIRLRFLLLLLLFIIWFFCDRSSVQMHNTDVSINLLIYVYSMNAQTFNLNTRKQKAFLIYAWLIWFQKYWFRDYCRWWSVISVCSTIYLGLTNFQMPTNVSANVITRKSLLMNWFSMLFNLDWSERSMSRQTKQEFQNLCLIHRTRMRFIQV